MLLVVLLVCCWWWVSFFHHTLEPDVLSWAKPGILFSSGTTNGSDRRMRRKSRFWNSGTAPHSWIRKPTMVHLRVAKRPHVCM